MEWFLSDFLNSVICHSTALLQLFLKGNIEAYWINLCPVLIDLVTNSKFTTVLNHRKALPIIKGSICCQHWPEGKFFGLIAHVGKHSAFDLFNCRSLSVGIRAALTLKFDTFALIFQRI